MLPGQISLILVLHFGQWCLGFDCLQDSHVVGLPKVKGELSFCCYIQALAHHRFPRDAQWELVKWNEVVFFPKKSLWYVEVAYFVNWIEADGLQILEAMFVNFLMYV